MTLGVKDGHLICSQKLVFGLLHEFAMTVEVWDCNREIFRYAQDDKSFGLWVKVLLEKKV